MGRRVAREHENGYDVRNCDLLLFLGCRDTTGQVKCTEDLPQSFGCYRKLGDETYGDSRVRHGRQIVCEIAGIRGLVVELWLCEDNSMSATHSGIFLMHEK